MKHLIRKELLQLMRNSFVPRLILIFPIMMVCIMPWVMDMEVKGVSVVVVDNDNSTLSRQLIQRLDASDRFTLVGMRQSYQEAMDDIEQCNADLIVEIPYDYERDAARGLTPSVLVASNAVNGTKGSLGASYASSVIMQNFRANEGEGINSISRVQPEVSEGQLQPWLHVLPAGFQQSVSFSTLYLYNIHLNYKRYMIPALFSLLVMMLCGFLPALNIVSEKEAGTIEQINVTPVSRFSFIFAKLIPYWVIAMLVITVCLILSWLIYGITSTGSIWLIYFVSLLLGITFSGLGLVISNYSDTMQQAIFVMWFFVMCMMLLSGLFTPISSMPDWAQDMTKLFPVSYYIDAVRTIFLRGGTLTDILPQTYALCLFAAILDLWAVFSYRKKN